MYLVDFVECGVADSLVCTSKKSVELCLCRTHEEVEKKGFRCTATIA